MCTEANVDTEYGIGDDEWGIIGWRGFDVGKRLKTVTGWSIDSGTDIFGFALLPGGYRSTPGVFYSIGSQSFLWSATTESSTDAWDRLIFNNEDRVFRYASGKNRSLSVRCLKN